MVEPLRSMDNYLRLHDKHHYDENKLVFESTLHFSFITIEYVHDQADEVEN
jgi:hypothetical protein